MNFSWSSHKGKNPGSTYEMKGGEILVHKGGYAQYLQYTEAYTVATDSDNRAECGS